MRLKTKNYFIMTLSFLILASCQNLMDQNVVDDSVSYSITIQSHGNGYTSPEGVVEVKNKPMNILAVAESGYRFSCWETSSGIILKNNRSASTTIESVKDNGQITAYFSNTDFPNISVTSDIQKIHLAWEDVSSALSYHVIYTVNSGFPGYSPVNGVFGYEEITTQSEFTLNQFMQIGSIYRFLVVAELSNGQLVESSIVEAVPLAPQTLAPKVWGGPGHIRLEWDNIQANRNKQNLRFYIYRSEDFDGHYNMIDETELNYYIDYNVKDGKWYFYKIKIAESILSNANGAQPDPLGSDKITLIGSYSTKREQRVTAAGDYAYLVNNDASSNNGQGMSVLDISNPALPRVQGVCSEVLYADQIEVQNNLVYLAAKDRGFQIVDVSQPAAPRLIDSFDTFTSGFYLEGNSAYLVGHFDMTIVDLDNLSEQGRYHFPEELLFQELQKIRVKDDNIYMANEHSLIKVNKNSLNTLSNIWIDTYQLFGASNRLFVEGNLALLHYSDSTFSDGIALWDISDPENIIPLNLNYDLGNFYHDPYSSFLKNQYLYVSDTGNRFKIFNLRDRDSSTPVYSSKSIFYPHEMYVDEHRALVLGMHDELSIFSVPMNPNPRVIDHIDVPHVSRVDIQGNRLFFSQDRYGIHVYDAIQKKEIQQIEYETFLYNFMISGNFLYNVVPNQPEISFVIYEAGADGFFKYTGSLYNDYTINRKSESIVSYQHYCLFLIDNDRLGCADVSDPYNPQGFYISNLPADAMDMVVRGNYIYLALEAGGFQIMDISDPTSPLAVNRISGTGAGQAILIIDDLLYLVNTQGLLIYSLEDPVSPAFLGTFALENISDFFIRGHFAYLISSNPGTLSIVNLSDKSAPQLAVSCSIPGEPEGISVSGRYAYIAAGSEGVQIVDLLYEE